MVAESGLRLEWATERGFSKAALGDYRLGASHEFDGERTTYGWSAWVTGNTSFAGGDGLATREGAQLAAEAALFARLEAYRPLLTDAENEALRKAMPNADMLFNAAYLLRGTWDDTCIAMAPSLEAAAARILALDADDDDQKIDALVELLRRA